MHNYHATQNGFDYEKEDQLAILRSIKKNTFNKKNFKKRAGGEGIGSNDGSGVSKKSLSTISQPDYSHSNVYNNGVLPNLKLGNLSLIHI